MAVPSPIELQRTLCKVTERLARELASPSQTAPDWSDHEGRSGRAVAAMHGISPLLSRSLVWRGPSTWSTFLDEQRTHTRARHWRIRRLMESIGQKACEAGGGGMALKGAALHQMGLYEAGDRPMADVDLFVRPADVERTAALLASLGFCQSGQTWKERIFTAVDENAPAELGEHSNNSLKIELHERICEKLPWRLTDMSEFIFPPQPRPGLNAYPSTASLMRHLLLHAAGSMAFQGLRILHLHDIALLAARMSDSDWNEIATSSSRGVRMWWAFPPLELLSRYHPTKVPARVLAALGEDCSYFLRVLAARKSLVDVSYSYIWVKAFPGIECAQSMSEFARFIASRVRPNAEHTARRKVVATTEAWAQPGEGGRLTQGLRMLRWMYSRPTRPATMHAVVAALSHAD